MRLIKESTNCDCGRKRLLKIENEKDELFFIELLSGDYYHDKIEYQIIGYLKALKDNKIEYEIENAGAFCPECEY